MGEGIDTFQRGEAARGGDVVARTEGGLSLSLSASPCSFSLDTDRSRETRTREIF
jgi:hypothetical protein